MQYDAIVVGAGAAGAVIAARLSEDPARSVLLLDAGPDYVDMQSTPDDLLNGYWNSTRAHDWRFRAHHSQEGRPHRFPRGRVVGGSTAVNTAIALRGVPEDYDRWAALGNPEWSWARVLPYFRDLEQDIDFDDDFHGRNGPIPVVRYCEDELVNWQAAFLHACRALGFPTASDNNDPDSTGVGPHPMNRRGRLRISTAIAYLAEARSRENLEIRGNAHTARVVLAGDRAVGVEIDLDGTFETVFGRQIILCAGAIQSPAILLRSGIGAREDTERLGVATRVELSGVGRHLLDHPTVGVTYIPREGVCRTDVPSVQVTLRYTAADSAERNDMQVMPVSFVDSEEGPLFLIGVCLEQVRGKGRLIVESLDPRAQPKIESHFCEDPEDLRRMVAGVRLALSLGETEPLVSLHRGIYRPQARHLESDETIGAWISRVAGSGYHPCGTAKMGPRGDADAVVDQYGRVHGIDGLFVADASIMPTVPRANTNLTTMMIGERVSQWLRNETLGPKVGAGVAARTAPVFAPAVRSASVFARSRDRGADYLERRQRTDGMIGDEQSGGLGGFYKGMYALTAAGRTRAATRLSAWIRDHAVTPAGDYAGDWQRGGLALVYPYPNAWLTAGLHRTGAYDLSSKGMDFLASMQDPESGGLFSRLDSCDAETRQEVMSSAMAGLAALVCGRTDVAGGVARFLRMILDAQPEPAARLCHVYTQARGVITEYPAHEAAQYAVIASRPRQAYFMYGIGAAFMVRYHLATGNSGALDDANRFLLPAYNATEAMYETAQVGKVAWGAALLAGVTGDSRHLELALRAAGALLAQQNPDGSWDNTGGYTTEGMRDEVTAEFVSIMDEVEAGLACVALERVEQKRSFASLAPTVTQ